ncbi:MAG: hypothetical protein MHPSP_003419, partial [Paramarteilia canceri]
MPTNRRSESSQRTARKYLRSSSRKNESNSQKYNSELRKASESVRSLEKILGSRSLSSERRLRHYSKARENCSNLVKLEKRNKLSEREQARSKRYRSELNRVSLMMKNKAMEKVNSAKRSGSRSEMRKASESTKAVANAIKSSELMKRSELLNNL